MACDGGGRPGRESKQCQQLMSGNRPGAEGLGRGTAIAHPDRRAGGGRVGGWGPEQGGSMRADRGSPGDPTLHTDRQTDRGEAARPPPPADSHLQLWPKGTCHVPSSLCLPWLPPSLQTVQNRGGKEIEPGTPTLHAGKQESGVLRPLSFLGLGFPKFTGEGRCTLRAPTLTFQPSPSLYTAPAASGTHPSRPLPPNLNASNRPSSSGWGESTPGKLPFLSCPGHRWGGSVLHAPGCHLSPEIAEF